MRFAKSTWFSGMRVELIQRGYQPTTAYAGSLSVYVLNGLTIEVRKRNMLRIIQRNGAVETYPHCTTERALRLIEAAERVA
ncbi:MAG TPA: hypothetical protein VNV41_16475 [Candidatus Acidoferrales bacterium]|jgi:hypothetical protein|nr:hypothetical protein [Candidatus Acidoferrales bacterium]